ncbi:MAG: exodeoxyribonuclease VII large subunit [Alphaproteobacteria bacterium]|nr:exodeoxyribonuclease VII large subunit [Alphaproteobacteria bacterium]
MFNDWGEGASGSIGRDSSEPIEFSVTEISQLLKKVVEKGFSYVRVRGEISGFKRAASGHMYFALKDEGAVLDAVCWRGQAAKLQIKPEDGMEIVCTGKITTYPGRSKYQIMITSMEVAGEGALLKLLEERKKKLAAEGLFAAERKKEIPYLPEAIGVVTSPTGSVIKDILHRLQERFPVHVLLWPALVQGEGAAEQISAGIKAFNDIKEGGKIPRPDVIIVARGGGSLEDLWCFNEEIVVRAAAASDIPLISGVGHETDTTLIDYVSDLRAPTPTGAAEKAVPVRMELLAAVKDLEARHINAARRLFDEMSLRIQGLARGLLSPTQFIEECVQRLDDRMDRVGSAFNALFNGGELQLARLSGMLRSPANRIDEAIEVVNQLSGRLPVAFDRTYGDVSRQFLELSERHDNCSYEKVLARGYAIIHDDAGKIVDSVAIARSRANLSIEMIDGSVGVSVDGGSPPPASKNTPKPKKIKPKSTAKKLASSPISQGDLFD